MSAARTEAGRLPLVALVGRPNVGKSTLFNRLVGERRAAVAALPGLTRDRNYGEAEWYGRRFRVVDTGGLDPSGIEGLFPLLRAQTELAIREADAVLCLFDGREGATNADHEVVALLRAARRRVVWCVNKVDLPERDDLLFEFHALGLDPLVALSAEHGIGVEAAVDAVLAQLGSEPGAVAESPVDDDRDGPIRVAIVGRPNVGKSSLLNRLVGLPRALVDDRPGTTVDPVDTLLRVGEREYLLVDTAGIRRHKRAAGPAEGLGVTLAFRAIERCQVALVVIDASVGITVGDLRVASLAAERGAALGLVVNKWDLVDRADLRPGDWKRDLASRLGDLAHVPAVTVSAAAGTRVPRILPFVDVLHAAGSKRVPTAELNRVLTEAVERHPPPLTTGHRAVRLYYGTQTGSLPPRFQLFTSGPDAIGPEYRRYLERRLREAFGFEGSPIRLVLRGRTRARSRSRTRAAPEEDAVDGRSEGGV